MIRKTKGGRYVLYSKKTGRALSKPGTLAEIKKRERQVQFFKHRAK